MVPVQQQQSQQQQPVRERQTIWQGVLEWIEKTKNPNDPQKLTRHVPCQVSANPKDGEPELKADSWPQKLIMQLMPKQLIGNIGGAYLKNSKSVLFHPQNCEALESLTKVMSSGFAGCVHFTSMSPTSACDIKVLILLYTSEKRAYLGFIPNDQTTFVDRLRRVIQQSKSTQALIRQGQGPDRQLLLVQQQQQQQQQSQQQQQQQQQQGPGGTMRGAQVLGGPGPQRPPFDNIEVARQQNLVKIQQLRETLEAAQQQELQYKSQLEIMSHMKIQQLQQTLEVAQQQEMQFKAHFEQEQQKQLRAQLQQMSQQQQRQMTPQVLQQQQQQRMMRPTGMANNPGLRHLLQQQPQYRQVLGQMQQQQQQLGGPVGVQRGGQQPGPGGQPQQQPPYDDVSGFDMFG